MFKQNICFETWGGEKGKYRLRDSAGNPIDQTPEDTCARVARALADVEPADKDVWFEKFKSILGTKFAGGGRIMANAGAQGYKRDTSLINCFAKGTTVTTPAGIKAIETVQCGDKVVTHNGRFQPVTKTFKNKLGERQLFLLKCFRTPALHVTDNHKFLSISKEQLGWGKSPSWNSVEYLRVGDWVAVPKINANQCCAGSVIDIYKDIFDQIEVTTDTVWYEYVVKKNTFALNSKWRHVNHKHKKNPVHTTLGRPINRYWTVDKDFAFFLGLWYGDGCIYSARKNALRSKGITFTFNAEEKGLIEFVAVYGEKLFGIAPDVNDNKHIDNSCQIMFNSPVVSNAFQHLFGRGFAGKQLAAFMYTWNEELVNKLLAGLISSDGTVTADGNVRVVMANAHFIKSVYHLARQHSIPVGYSEVKKLSRGGHRTARIDFPKQSNIIKLISKAYNDDRVEKYAAAPEIHTRTKFIDGQLFVQIMEKKPITTNDEFVYTLEVQTDHSYVVEGVICQNCTVMRQIGDSMFAILSVATEAALTLKAGCGVGYDFSTIRPSGAYVFGAGAETSGVMSFIDIFNSICKTVMSGGGRRGAQMGCLDIQHPDIEQFILSKRTKGAFAFFNFSVLITDRFMDAVQNETDWDLWFWEKTDDKPDNVCIIRKNDIPYNHPTEEYFSFAEDHVECVFSGRSPEDVFKKAVFRTVPANELFELITKSTYNHNDPGFILIDKVNRENNLWFIESIRATNPCVTGDTLVLTTNGLMSAKELEGKVAEVPVDVRMGSGTRKTSVMTKTRTNAEIFKLQTEEGYTLRATADHKIMAPNGWVKLGDLKQGDGVDIFSRTEKLVDTVVSVIPDGIEDVYDWSVEDVHAFIANGIVISNCAEQPLSPLSNCLLGSMILPAYVRNPCTADARFDWESYKKDICIAARMLDNVVEISNLPLPELEANLRYQRRHGMGFTGLGSALNMLSIKYNSEDGLAFAREATKALAMQNLLAGIELAQEKGPAPCLEDAANREAYLESGYNAKLLCLFDDFVEVEEKIRQFGVRWSHATSIAPTGTLSFTWGNNCSSGLEPVFMNNYLRNIRMSGKKTKTQVEALDYAYYEWKNLNGDDPLPGYWTVADDLSVHDHINMQAAIQEYIDSSISKTINVPTEYAYDDFKDVYFYAWEKGLKGVTTYRFVPEKTSGVLVRKEDLANTRYVFVMEDGEEVEVRGDEQIEYDGETHVAANLYEALNEGIYGAM